MNRFLRLMQIEAEVVIRRVAATADGERTQKVRVKIGHARATARLYIHLYRCEFLAEKARRSWESLSTPMPLKECQSEALGLIVLWLYRYPL
jgi:hypothetical protein